jgi:BirA family biotin operon repressor/biotin-[acetyl-CoA-carboxylase] ligase
VRRLQGQRTGPVAAQILLTFGVWRRYSGGPMHRETAILEALYQAAGEFVSAEQLGRLLRLPAAAVAAELRQLEQLGYSIEVHPHLGWRLVAVPDRLMADDIRARLRSRLIGSEIIVFEQTGSTNDVVEQLARSGGREGLVVFAEAQTRGRGRLGRGWLSPRGKGLWFSVLLRPPLPAAAIARITVAAGVAVARALRRHGGVDARIKWPNDVTVGDKKIAGILTEMRAEAGRVLLAVLGIGINVNCRRDELPPGIATSLLLETGRPHDRAALAAEVLNALEQCYEAALGRFEAVIEQWAGLCTTLGKQIIIIDGSRRLEGCALALDGDGALLLRKDNGQTERILGGDVTVQK